MKRNEYMIFSAPGHAARKGRVSAVYDDMNPPACRLDFGNTEMVVRQSECLPEPDYKAMKEAEKKARQEQRIADELEASKKKYADVIKAWESGARTLQEIAEKLGASKTGLWSRVNAAMKRGLIVK